MFSDLQNFLNASHSWAVNCRIIFAVLVPLVHVNQLLLLTLYTSRTQDLYHLPFTF